MTALIPRRPLVPAPLRLPPPKSECAVKEPLTPVAYRADPAAPDAVPAPNNDPSQRFPPPLTAAAIHTARRLERPDKLLCTAAPRTRRVDVALHGSQWPRATALHIRYAALGER